MSVFSIRGDLLHRIDPLSIFSLSCFHASPLPPPLPPWVSVFYSFMFSFLILLFLPSFHMPLSYPSPYSRQDHWLILQQLPIRDCNQPLETGYLAFSFIILLILPFFINGLVCWTRSCVCSQMHAAHRVLCICVTKRGRMTFRRRCIHSASASCCGCCEELSAGEGQPSPLLCSWKLPVCLHGSSGAEESLLCPQWAHRLGALSGDLAKGLHPAYLSVCLSRDIHARDKGRGLRFPTAHPGSAVWCEYRLFVQFSLKCDY